MVQARTKNKVYGKQRRANELDLIAAFDSLNLAPVLPPVRKIPQGLANGYSVKKEKASSARPFEENRSEETNQHKKRTPLDPSSANVETSIRSKSNGLIDKNRTETGIENCISENRISEQTANDGNLQAFQKDVLPQPRNTDCSDQSALVQPVRVKKKKRCEDAAKLVRTELPSSRKPNDLPPPAPSVVIRIPEIQKLTSLPDVDCEIKTFDTQFDLWAKAFHITKVGQGSYAAIFRLRLLTDSDIYTIWKLMPLKPNHGKGSRAQGATSIDDATTELKALIAMSQSTGFVEYRSACILMGQLPKALAVTSAEWDALHLHDDPGPDYSSLPDDQVWLFMEMTDAGTDLEKVLANGLTEESRARQRDTTVKGPGPSNELSELRPNLSAGETWDIFWGVVQALAHGEEHAEFEHRDLHPGNVCVSNLPSVIHPEKGLQHDWKRPKFTNIEVTLIDYTLSRARLENGEILANPMRDKSLFQQNSNIESDQAQYDTYRTMRQFVAGKSIGRKTEPERWSDFVPETNLLWLHHLLTILLKQTKGSIISRGKFEVVGTDDEHHQLAVEMLEFLMEEIRPQWWPTWPWRSAKDLWSEAWFSEGFKMEEVGIFDQEQ